MESIGWISITKLIEKRSLLFRRRNRVQQRKSASCQPWSCWRHDTVNIVKVRLSLDTMGQDKTEQWHGTTGRGRHMGNCNLQFTALVKYVENSSSSKQQATASATNSGKCNSNNCNYNSNNNSEETGQGRHNCEHVLNLCAKCSQFNLTMHTHKLTPSHTHTQSHMDGGR